MASNMKHDNIPILKLAAMSLHLPGKLLVQGNQYNDNLIIPFGLLA